MAAVTLPSPSPSAVPLRPLSASTPLESTAAPTPSALIELVAAADFDECGFRDAHALWTALVLEQSSLRLSALRSALPALTVLRASPATLSSPLLEDTPLPLSPSARLLLLPRALRVVVVLDVSASLSVLARGQVLFERLHDALAQLLAEFTQPLRISTHPHAPRLHLSIAAQSGALSGFHCLVHNVTLTARNMRFVVAAAQLKLRKLEAQLVALPSSSAASGSGAVSGESESATLSATLRSAHALLQLLPASAAPHVLLVTDAVSSIALENALSHDSALLALARSLTRCSVLALQATPLRDAALGCIADLSAFAHVAHLTRGVCVLWRGSDALRRLVRGVCVHSLGAVVTQGEGGVLVTDVRQLHTLLQFDHAYPWQGRPPRVPLFSAHVLAQSLALPWRVVWHARAREGFVLSDVLVKSPLTGARASAMHGGAQWTRTSAREAVLTLEWQPHVLVQYTLQLTAAPAHVDVSVAVVTYYDLYQQLTALLQQSPVAAAPASLAAQLHSFVLALAAVDRTLARLHAAAAPLLDAHAATAALPDAYTASRIGSGLHAELAEVAPAQWPRLMDALDAEVVLEADAEVEVRGGSDSASSSPPSSLSRSQSFSRSLSRSHSAHSLELALEQGARAALTERIFGFDGSARRVHAALLKWCEGNAHGEGDARLYVRLLARASLRALVAQLVPVAHGVALLRLHALHASAQDVRTHRLALLAAAQRAVLSVVERPLSPWLPPSAAALSSVVSHAAQLGSARAFQYAVRRAFPCSARVTLAHLLHALVAARRREHFAPLHDGGGSALLWRTLLLRAGSVHDSDAQGDVRVHVLYRLAGEQGALVVELAMEPCFAYRAPAETAHEVFRALDSLLHRLDAHVHRAVHTLDALLLASAGVAELSADDLSAALLHATRRRVSYAAPASAALRAQLQRLLERCLRAEGDWHAPTAFAARRLSAQQLLLLRLAPDAPPNALDVEFALCSRDSAAQPPPDHVQQVRAHFGEASDAAQLAGEGAAAGEWPSAASDAEQRVRQRYEREYVRALYAALADAAPDAPVPVDELELLRAMGLCARRTTRVQVDVLLHLLSDLSPQRSTELRAQFEQRVDALLARHWARHSASMWCFQPRSLDAAARPEPSWLDEAQWELLERSADAHDADAHNSELGAAQTAAPHSPREEGDADAELDAEGRAVERAKRRARLGERDEHGLYLEPLFLQRALLPTAPSEPLELHSAYLAPSDAAEAVLDVVARLVERCVADLVLQIVRKEARAALQRDPVRRYAAASLPLLAAPTRARVPLALVSSRARALFADELDAVGGARVVRVEAGVAAWLVCGREHWELLRASTASPSSSARAHVALLVYAPHASPAEASALQASALAQLRVAERRANQRALLEELLATRQPNALLDDDDDAPVTELVLPLHERLGADAALKLLAGSVLQSHAVQQRAHVFVLRDEESASASSAIVYLALSASPGSLRCAVHGVAAPSAALLSALRRSWQAKLDESVAQLLATLLARNPLLKLTRADLDFLMPADAADKTDLRHDLLQWSTPRVCAGVLAQWRLTLAHSGLARVHVQQPADAALQLHVYNHAPSKPAPQPTQQPLPFTAAPAVALVYARLGHGLALLQVLHEPAPPPCAHVDADAEPELQHALSDVPVLDARADASAASTVRVRVWTREKLMGRVDALAAHLGAALQHAQLEHCLERTLAPYAPPTANATAADDELAPPPPLSPAALVRAQQLAAALQTRGAPSVRTSTWRVRVPAWDVHATLVELNATLRDALSLEEVALFLRTHPDAPYTPHALGEQSAAAGASARSRDWADLSGHSASVTGAAQFVFAAVGAPSSTQYESGSSLVLLHFSAFELALVAYNCHASALYDRVHKQVQRLAEWSRLRTHLLSAVLHQKLGLFAHLPPLADSGAAEAEMRAHYLHGAMDLLMRNAAPVRTAAAPALASSRRAQDAATTVGNAAASGSAEVVVPFERVLRHGYAVQARAVQLMRVDPVHWHAQQFRAIAARAQTRWRQQRALQAMLAWWAREKAPPLPTAEPVLALLRSARLLHTSRIPPLQLAHDERDAEQPATPPAATGERLLAEYAQHVQRALGLTRVVVAAAEGAPVLCFALHAEGALVLALSCARNGRLHCELFAWQTTQARSLPQRAVAVRDALHTNSFVYDFHLRHVHRALASPDSAADMARAESVRVLRRLSELYAHPLARKYARNLLRATRLALPWTPRHLTAPPVARALFDVMRTHAASCALTVLADSANTLVLAADLRHSLWAEDARALTARGSLALLLHLDEGDELAVSALTVHVYALLVDDSDALVHEPRDLTPSTPLLEALCEKLRARLGAVVARALAIYARQALLQALQAAHLAEPSAALRSTRTLPAVAAAPAVSASSSLAPTIAFTAAHLRELLDECVQWPLHLLDPSLHALAALAPFSPSQVASLAALLMRRFWPHAKHFDSAASLVITVPRADIFLLITFTGGRLQLALCRLRALPPLSDSSGAPSSDTQLAPEVAAVRAAVPPDSGVGERIASLVNELAAWLWQSSCLTQQ